MHTILFEQPRVEKTHRNAKWIFKATKRFWKQFDKLTVERKETTRHVWKIFKNNPFDKRILNDHKVETKFGKLYCVIVDGDLRVTFDIIKNQVRTFEIGLHKELYK